MRLTGLLIAALIAACTVTATSFGAGSHSVGLAFVKDGAATPTVWAADGQGHHQRKLGAGLQAVVSPNGALVAAGGASSGGPGLEIYRAAGGRLPKAPEFTGRGVTPLAWSPDSRFLAVTIGNSGSGAGAGNAELAVIDTVSDSTVATVPGMVDGASFAPTGPTRLVLDLATPQASGLSFDLHVLTLRARTGPARFTLSAVTRNGHSIDPVWGKHGIVFVTVTQRGTEKAPAYRLSLLDGDHVRAVASPSAPALQDGLIPLAISADGEHLIADFVGEDTSLAYTVDLATNRYAMVKYGRFGAQPWGISRDGKRLLISYGGFEAPSTHATIATIPFAGGRPTTLVKHADLPSWNQ